MIHEVYWYRTRRRTHGAGTLDCPPLGDPDPLSRPLFSPAPWLFHMSGKPLTSLSGSASGTLVSQLRKFLVEAEDEEYVDPKDLLACLRYAAHGGLRKFHLQTAA